MFQFKQVAGTIAVQALLLLGAATVRAGVGDIDPNYGIGGSLERGPGMLLTLPDDRLVVVADESESAFKVRVIAGNGRDDPAFGDGGQIVIPTPAETPLFVPSSAALGPHGELLITGTLWATAQTQFFETILRLDAAGQPDTSFGGQGDAFYRLTDTPIENQADSKTTVAAFGVDPSGRIVMAKHGWTPENACGGPMIVQRLLPDGETDTEFGTSGEIELPGLDLCLGVPLFGLRSDGSIVVGDGRNIAAVDATGAIDVGFGVDGYLSSGMRTWTHGFVLPDGGLLVFGPGDESTVSTVHVLKKFGRNGQADTTYGSGTGSAIVEFDEAFTRIPNTRGLVFGLLLAPDGSHLYADLRISRTDESIVCIGIARLSIDGVPDAGFGNHGLTCLSYEGTPYRFVSVQKDGAPVFETYPSPVLYRLLPDAKPSPGMLTVVGGLPGSNWANESDGRINVRVMRVAGRDGAVSADYVTSELSCGVNEYYCLEHAGAGTDYVAASGRLDWASGEDGERAVSVTIVDDHASESNEAFLLEISQVEGGAQLFGGAGWAGIQDDDEASSPIPTENPTPADASGGGGSMSWATQLALLTLLLFHRRRNRRAAAG